eukprot:2762826-Lingulodinium_polyedra.AAC.1
MPLVHGRRRSQPSAPVSMPLDMDVDVVRCKNERCQRGNGPFGSERKPAPQVAPSRNAMKIGSNGS